MRRSLVLLLCLSGCSCLPVPSSDSTPPTAALLVEYRVPGGERVTKSVDVNDPDLTIVASPNDRVAVLYSGGDDEGLRKVELEYDTWHRIGCCSVEQGGAVAKFEQSNCPKKMLAGRENFNPVGGWNYRFRTRSENWIGTSTRTATLTVMTQ